MDQRQAQLEELFRSQSKDGTPISPANLFELVEIYGALQKYSELNAMIRSLLSLDLPQPVTLQLAQRLTRHRQFQLAEALLVKYLSAQPDETKIWIELAAMRLAGGQLGPALATIEKAVELDRDNARALLLKDPRFRPLYNNRRFQTLVPPNAPKQPIQFNNLF